MPEVIAIPAFVAFAGPAVALAVLAIGRLTAPSLSTTTSGRVDRISTRRRTRTEPTHG